MSLPIEDIKKLNVVELNTFLKQRLSNIKNHIDTVTDQDVNGQSFLGLTEEVLTCNPDSFQLKYEPASKICNFIKSISKYSIIKCQCESLNFLIFVTLFFC